MEYMSTTLQQLRDFWEKVSVRYDAAVQKKYSTRAAFTADADRRDQVIRDTVSELEKELDRIRQQAVIIGGRYGNALSAGNQEEADRLQAETDNLTMKEFQITRRKEAVAKTKIVYDKELFDAAVEAYNQADNEYDSMNAAGCELEETIEKVIRELEQLKNTVNEKRNSYSAYDDEVHGRMLKRMQQGSAGTE